MRRRPLPLAVLASIFLLAPGGCGGSDEGGAAPEAKPCMPTSALSERGVEVSGCGFGVRLLPQVKIGGAWRSASSCASEAGGLSCAVDGGALRVTGPLPEVSVGFVPSADVEVEGVGLEGEAVVPGATAWLSNGFQSWSQTGLVAPGPFLAEEALMQQLSRRGDEEVLREGDGFSWLYTYAGGGEQALFVGATTAARLRSYIAFGDGKARVASGGTGERVKVAAGQVFEGERLRLEAGPDLPAMLARHGAALASRAREVKPRAEAGWNSWYELWDGVDEQAVRENADLAAQALSGALPPSAPPLRIVVDDGWQKAWGDWDTNERFPSGLDGLAKDLGKKGMNVGVWLAPLLAAEQSAVFTEHPGWFLPDASYKHAKNGTMRVLDVTNDEARAHLSGVIKKLVGWGYTLLKIDFLFAGTFEGARAKPATGMEAYSLALQTIREAAGDGAALLAVGAPALPTLAYAEGWRVGPDIALEPSGVRFPFLASQARTLASRYHLCQITLCDADPALLRGLPREEVELGAWVAAMGGGAFFLSDDLRKLPAERLGWGIDAARVAQGLAGVSAVPLDLFPEGAPARLPSAVIDLVTQKNSHLVPRLWQTPQGGKLAVNFTDEPAEIAGAQVPPHSGAAR